MRIAAIYDIHGNPPALEAVLQEIRREKVDQIIVGGDVLPGPFPRETLEILQQFGPATQFIYCNGEVAVLEQMAGKEYLRNLSFRPERTDAFSSPLLLRRCRSAQWRNLSSTYDRT
ncbi:MAG: metallophosphoesterase [Acidobacteriota bacterium]|nr:metallophosphoesterase [Acidobacteriota bacterium]